MTVSTDIQKLYIAYFNRPADFDGLIYWQNQAAINGSVANVANAFSASAEYTSLYAGKTNVEIIDTIYQNLFGRSAEPAGLTFWSTAMTNGIDIGHIAISILKGAQNGDLTAINNKVTAATTFTNALDTTAEIKAYSGDAANYVAKEWLKQVTTDASLATAVSSTTIATLMQDVAAANGIQYTGVFTLTESISAATEGTPAVYGPVMWGYNPHSHSEGTTDVDNTGAGDSDTSGVISTPGNNEDNLSNEGPSDGGIPVADLISFLTTITGLDLKELGLVDAAGQQTFANVTSLTISNAVAGATASGTGTATSTTPTLNIGYADGSSMNAEVALGDGYFKFLNDLLFDDQGNSRLYQQVVKAATSGTNAALQYIKLTPTVNNGGTIELGTITAGNDTIVAGRLDLLQGAYIDGGAGYNTLEIDAKGTYAQPQELLNIQEIHVNDLPNWYTTSTGLFANDANTVGSTGTSVGASTGSTNGTSIPVDYNGTLNNGYLNNSSYPLLSPTEHTNDSWLDLSRATALKKLVISDSGATDSVVGTSEASGKLTIVGIRNAGVAGNVTRLEGNFADDLTLQYGQGQSGTLSLELALGDVTGNINLLQNASVLNIDSQGVENHMHAFFAGGSISRMVIKGTGVFGVDENLQASFNAGRPAIIDASANTGGLDVNLSGHYKVNITGTAAADEIISNGPIVNSDAGWSTANGLGNTTAIANPAISQGDVTIDAGNGANAIQADGRNIVNITTGTGNDNIQALLGANVTIVAGNGTNVVKTDGSTTVSITTGTGADNISAKNGNVVTIVAGDGNNVINADVASGNDNFGINTVDITSGAGNDTISAVRGGVVTIDAGAGNNTITVSANEVSVTTGAGNDKVYVSGLDTTFDNGDFSEGGTGSTAGGFNDSNTDNYGVNGHFSDAVAPGALLTLNLGAGTNTVFLGRDVTDLDSSADVDAQFGVTALEGSVITGTGIKLYVENNSDLTLADITEATITSVALKQELRITDNQFTAIGAAAFSVVRDEEGATEDLYLVVDSDTSLTAILNGATLNTAVRLHVELRDGATLSVTAEQLHKQFAESGISGIDGLNGKLVITDAGLNFDAFVNGANYQVIDGGTVTTAGDLDISATEDVTIIRSIGGFERPAPTVSTDTLTINSDVTPAPDALAAIISEVNTVKITGAADITFTKAIDLGRDATAPLLADGVTRGDLVAPETDAFTIDFSALTGNLIGGTIANFQDVKQIKGNGDATHAVRLNVELTNGSTVGTAGNGNGLKSSGVQTYVVTHIGDDSTGEDAAASAATIYVCDMSADVKVLGLRGNYNDSITYHQVNWGTNFLLEGGGTAKADGNPSYSNVGTLNADYFWTPGAGPAPYANAIVNIVNLDAAGSVRPLHVEGINIDNADSLTINADSNLIIESLMGNQIDDLTFSAGTNNVTVKGDVSGFDAEGLQTLDASAVGGVFTLQLTNAVANDLSNTTVTGLDKVVFDFNNAELTLTVDQAIAVGAANVTTTAGVTGTTLNFEDLGTQAIDLTAFGAKAIGTVSIADVNGTVTLDPTTVLGNADRAATDLSIHAETSSTTVMMTAAQFDQLAGTGTVDIAAGFGHDATTGVNYTAGITLTNVANNAKIDLSLVGASVVQTVQLTNVVATSAFKIVNGGAADNVIIEVSGVTDLTKATVPNLEAIGAVTFTGDATLTLTAAQLAAIPFTDVNADGIADNWIVAAGANVKLNIVDVENGFALDLSFLEKAGVDIGTLTLKDSNGAIVLDAAANLANADSIVTPTKDAVTGVEATSLTLTAAQFNQLAGAGTITGDAQVNLTGLVNNTDSDANFSLDVAAIDVTGITAPHGTVTFLGGLGNTTVTLATAASLAGFEIQLANGEMIRFNTETQASGAKITELAGTTAVAWLFDSATSVIDTANYSSSINTLYINEDLVDGQVEESLWTTLAQEINVEKVNKAGIPDVLVAFDRVNTFEALTAIAGVNYDNQSEFESTSNLTINLEGNTNIGTVTLGDTNGEGVFDTLTINSYEDRSTLVTDNNFTFQPNKVGNISLNAGSTDELVSVELNTYANADNNTGTVDGGFTDAVNVNSAVAERDGLALEVGTVTFAANTATTAELTITGSNKVTIAGVDITDAEVSLLKIDASAHVADAVAPTLAEPKLLITGVNGGADVGAFDNIYVVDGHTTAVADAAEFATVGNNLLDVRSGANDLTKAVGVDIDKVYLEGGTLTLTAAQVLAIGTADVDADGKADAWTGLNGAKLIITDLSTEILDLAKVAAAGVDIAEISIKAGLVTVTLDPLTTLGDADSIAVPVDTTLNLSAKQFEQLKGTGTITGAGAGTHQGIVNITGLTVAEASIDLTGVTAKNGTITLGYDDATAVTPLVNEGDVALTAAAKLNAFSVTLDDITSTVATNEVLGQTIRFANAAQAERQIIVVGADTDADPTDNAWAGVADGYFERDTNVVWAFNTITGTTTAGKIDTSKYSAALGRVWVNDALVDGQNIESIFSSPSAIETNPTTGVVNLASTTIIRIVDTAALSTLPPDNVGVSRHIEVESFTSLPAGLVFNNADKLVGVSDLTIDLGGNVTLGTISIDDVVAASINPATNNEFNGLTINSLLASAGTDTYLLPEAFDPLVNAYPSVKNVVGNISSGATRDELNAVTLNTFTGGKGVALDTGTITFTEDEASGVDADPIAFLTVTGDKNVNITSVNTADAEITALTVNVAGYTGVLTAPGASPAFSLNATETLTFTNGDVAAGTITLGRTAAGAVTANAGVAGNELSFINASAFDGTLNLGIVAQIDSTNDDRNADGDTIDLGDAAFNFTAGNGVTTMTLAAANGLTPTLNTGSVWNFDYTNAIVAGSYLKLTPTVMFQAGSTLNLTNVPLVIEGAVNLAGLVDNVATLTVTEGLFMTGGTIFVPVGASLTLTAAQVDALNIGGVSIQGAGTLKVTGDASGLVLGANIHTAIVDLSAATINGTTDLEVTTTGLTGALSDAVAPVATAQTVIGSGAIDTITLTSLDGGTITGGAGNDVVTSLFGNNTFNVDAGTDTIVGVDTGDALVVTAGATANVTLAGNFVATAATVNNGTVNFTDGTAFVNSTIDLSLATGGNGFNVTGGTDDLLGLDVLIGSSKADVLNGGNNDQSLFLAIDTLTGNGGADTFAFNVSTSVPVDVTNSTTTANIDREQIQITFAATADNSLTIAYSVNGVVAASPVVVAVLATDGVNAVASKVAAAFGALSGFSALSIGDTVSISGANGSSLTIGAITTPDATLMGAASNGTDIAQIERVDVGTAVLGNVTAGEIYTVDITLAGAGSAIHAVYNAVFGDNEANVAAGLATQINLLTGTVNAAAAMAGGVWGINITDTAPDNGGFTVTTTETGGFAGSGASINGAADLTTADVITDFLTGTDHIDFNLNAGSLTNFIKAGEVANYATALADADLALNGVVQYYLTSVLDSDLVTLGNQTTGVLFFDANADGVIDGVVSLTGISNSNFVYSDIVA